MEESKIGQDGSASTNGCVQTGPGMTALVSNNAVQFSGGSNSSQVLTNLLMEVRSDDPFQAASAPSLSPRNYIDEQEELSVHFFSYCGPACIEKNLTTYNQNKSKNRQ